MPYQIITEETFEAAHTVEGHPKCGNLHGHTWKVVVCIEADQLPEDREFDFVVDFGKVKERLRAIVPDHRYLNDEFAFSPTSENLAKWFYEQMEYFEGLAWVEVWEGLKNRCRYSSNVSGMRITPTGDRVTIRELAQGFKDA
jgi:6-pyruvoyltetrahydropterin/6-carboxytetrahydropterin synthase